MRKWLRELLRMFAKTGERGMSECSMPIVEATDNTKAEATELTLCSALQDQILRVVSILGARNILGRRHNHIR